MPPRNLLALSCEYFIEDEDKVSCDSCFSYLNGICRNFESPNFDKKMNRNSFCDCYPDAGDVVCYFDD